jgi:hypothetical protein
LVYGVCCTETANVSDAIVGIRTTTGLVDDTVQATDVDSALAIFLATVLENTSAADTDESSGDTQTRVAESAQASDRVSSRFLWEPINDDQTPNWKPINTVN